MRAVAAVHVAIGVAAMFADGMWLTKSLMQAHGPNDLGAAGLPFLAAAFAVAAVGWLGVACLLWKRYRAGRWMTAAFAAIAATVCAYGFFGSTSELLMSEWSVWRQGGDSNVPHYTSAALIEVLTTIWCAGVCVELFRPTTCSVFLHQDRDAPQWDEPVRLPFFTAPSFIAGIILWVLVAMAVAGLNRF